MPYTAHRKGSRHRIVTDVEISLHTYYLDGEIESSQFVIIDEVKYGMMKILFVCHGNICRSPMAEFYMKDLVNRNGDADRFVIESRATTREEIPAGRGNPIYPPALDQLMIHGIGTKGNELGVHAKRARIIQANDYCDYDLLIGMDEENIEMLHAKWNDPDHKIHLLLSYAGLDRSVADPWFTRNFEAAWDDIVLGCDALYQAVSK